MTFASMLTEADKTYIDTHWSGASCEDIAQRLGARSYHVKKYCSQMGFSRPVGRPSHKAPRGRGIDIASREKFFNNVNAIAGIEP